MYNAKSKKDRGKLAETKKIGLLYNVTNWEIKYEVIVQNISNYKEMHCPTL